jgi:hypothetical protein
VADDTIIALVAYVVLLAIPTVSLAVQTRRMRALRARLAEREAQLSALLRASHVLRARLAVAVREIRRQR